MPNKIQPFITSDYFFNKIMEKVKLCENFERANIDYVSSSKWNIYNLTTDEFDPQIEVMRGGCEGSYINIYLQGDFDESLNIKNNQMYIGCLKTLDEGEACIRNMYALAADIHLCIEKIRNEYSEKLDRQGYAYGFNNKDGYYAGGFTSRDPEITEKTTCETIFKEKVVPSINKKTYLNLDNYESISVRNLITLEEQNFTISQLKEIQENNDNEQILINRRL